MLYRLEAMFLQAADFPINAIRRQITEGIDIMVHMGRMPGGSRKVVDISEVAGIENGEIVLGRLFEFDGESGLLRKTGNELHNKDKLRMNGFEL